jgi:CheY-like chemotaxis protein/HPt (histidine-containing phosphotransfer) domain-containing protein
MRVLLAEDNPVNQEVAVGMLESLGCKVTVVENGREAVEAIDDGDFDLVLMDCQMPILNGFEATRMIRATETDGFRLPILALTANAFEGSKAECLAHGMDDMLNKPFKRQELLSLLDRWRPAPSEFDQEASTAEDAPGSSQLDLGPIESLRALDPDGTKQLVRRAVHKFADYGKQLLARMKESICENDLAELSRLAHSLKSSSANLGASDLAGQCAEIEDLIRCDCMPSDIDRRLERLGCAHRSAMHELLLLADG